jgi:putative ABC transport system permease protein
MRVLIAEDEQRLADAIARGLRREGMAVDLAADGPDAKGQFTTLLLGLGAVALLVGAIGIANIMVISVLERRGEIGLRRALGATRRHISTQFLAESALLAALGGIAGLLLGALATLVYSLAQNEPWVVPTYVLIAAPAAGFAIGAIAGLYPAAKAARLSPTEALRAT